MKKIYFLRHGETNHNVWIKNAEYSGSRFTLEDPHDTNLNERGRDQAIQAGKEFDASQIDAVYVSPLQRARDTLELFSQGCGLELPVIVDNRIEELRFGAVSDFDRMHTLEANEVYGKNIQHDLMNLVYDNTAFGGEHWQETEQRVREFLHYIQTSPEQCVLVCAHAAVIRFVHKILLQHISPTIYTHLQIKNCSISEFIIAD